MMQGDSLLVIWIAALLSGFCGQGHGQAQNAEQAVFVLNIKSGMQLCDEGSGLFVDASDIEFEWHNETCGFLKGNIAFPLGFSENTMLSIKVEKENNGRYEMIFTHEVCNLCDELEDKDSAYAKYLAAIEFPEKCPFKPGAYYINNLMADMSELPINSANLGDYLITMEFFSNPSANCKEETTKLACLTVDAAIDVV